MTSDERRLRSLGISNFSANALEAEVKRQYDAAKEKEIEQQNFRIKKGRGKPKYGAVGSNFTRKKKRK